MTTICYFSGTGNSYWSAKKIAEALQADDKVVLVNIGLEIEKEKIPLEADAVIFVYPAYAYGAPPIVRRFVKKADIKANYVASIVTLGSSQGGALAEIARILKKKNSLEGASFYYGEIPAVENYMTIFGSPSEKTRVKRTAMQTEATAAVIADLKARKENKILTFRPLSAFVSLMYGTFYRWFYISFRCNDTCTGCGICASVCPVGAIAMKEANGKKKPAFSKKCSHCQGCINWCPQRAINYITITPKTRRYTHPEVKAADMKRAAG